jgi:hypothetical protein
VGRRRLASFVLAIALVAGAGSASASASTSAGRPPGSPDLAAMALAATDFPGGAKVVRQRYYRDPDFVAAYERELSLAGSRFGRSSLIYVFNDLSVEATARDAEVTLSTLRGLLRTKAFRNLLAREISAAAEVGAASVAVGLPRTPRIGDGAVVVAIKLKAEGLTFQTALTFMRVDRVLGVVGVVGFPGRRVFSADVDRLSRVSAERMRAALVPAVSAPPVVTGTLNPGQTLSATPGTWSGDQIVFSYQWERCADVSTGCAPIPGATAATHTVGTGDLASTMRVTVSGRNRLGSATATSATTGFVSGPVGAPVATAAPGVEGVVGPGATLTATTGTWTGNPTSFAYQWRRCSPTTGACVDIPGATGSTYTLSAADSGSVMRVLVVATNAAGSNGAFSPPTAPAP